MAKCGICGRPATAQLTVREGGTSRQVALCGQHYAQAMGGLDRPPLESLFHGSPTMTFSGTAARRCVS